MKAPRLLAAASLVCAVAHAAAAQRVPVGVEGEGPYYRLVVPAATYASALGPDLAELRVRNAAGLAVPFAWDDRAANTGAVEWMPRIAPVSCTADACDYRLPRNVPVQRLRIEMEQSNTLAQVQVVAMVPAGTPPPRYERHHHHLHDPLKLLRRREHPADVPQVAAGDVERPLAEAVVYRVLKNGVEEKSVEVTLDGGAYASLRVRVRGGIAQLGRAAPGIEIATRERALVFLASGAGPFTATWGEATRDPGALPLATLVPHYKPGKPLAAGVAKMDAGLITLPALAASPVPNPAAPQPRAQPAKAASTPAAQPREYNPWLWGALLAAIAALGAMAWSLLRTKPGAP